MRLIEKGLVILTDNGMLEGFYDSALVLAVCRVEVVLDAIVGATRQLFRDVSPPVAILLMQVKNSFFFVLVDRRFFNKRIQMIVPSNYSS